MESFQTYFEKGLITEEEMHRLQKNSEWKTEQEAVSPCCGAEITLGICGFCKEHCE